MSDKDKMAICMITASIVIMLVSIISVYVAATRFKIGIENRTVLTMPNGQEVWVINVHGTTYFSPKESR